MYLMRWEFFFGLENRVIQHNRPESDIRRTELHVSVNDPHSIFFIQWVGFFNLATGVLEMTIAVSFGFLIIRKSSIENQYPGGITQFRQEWMPKQRKRPVTGEDEHLFGFSTEETQPSPDLVFGTVTTGLLTPCDWLQIEELAEPLGGREPFMVCWLAGSKRGEIVEGKFC